MLTKRALAAASPPNAASTIWTASKLARNSVRSGDDDRSLRASNAGDVTGVDPSHISNPSRMFSGTIGIDLVDEWAPDKGVGIDRRPRPVVTPAHVEVHLHLVVRYEPGRQRRTPSRPCRETSTSVHGGGGGGGGGGGRRRWRRWRRGITAVTNRQLTVSPLPTVTWIVPWPDQWRRRLRCRHRTGRGSWCTRSVVGNHRGGWARRSSTLPPALAGTRRCHGTGRAAVVEPSTSLRSLNTLPSTAAPGRRRRGSRCWRSDRGGIAATR